MLSRSRIFRLEPLTHEQVLALLQRAFHDPERGDGGRHVSISDDALARLADVAHGDARSALNALELAVESTPPDEHGVSHMAEAEVEEAGQTEVALHLKDSHYKGAARLGHGKGYQYPHSFPGHHVAQQYLPDALVGRRFYEPRFV